MHTAFSINQSLKILEFQEQTYAEGSRCTQCDREHAWQRNSWNKSRRCHWGENWRL